MTIEFQVLGLSDLDEVYGFAERHLVEAMPDETERMFHSWQVRWRREALEHYLKLGWSFIARDTEGRTLGFFLGQPFFVFPRADPNTLG